MPAITWLGSGYLTEEESLDQSVTISVRLKMSLVTFVIAPLLHFFLFFYPFGMALSSRAFALISSLLYVTQVSEVTKFANLIYSAFNNIEFVAFGSASSRIYGLIKGNQDYFMNIFAAGLAASSPAKLVALQILVAISVFFSFISIGGAPLILTLMLPVMLLLLPVIDWITKRVSDKFSEPNPTLRDIYRQYPWLNTAVNYGPLYKNFLNTLTLEKTKEWCVRWIQNFNREITAKVTLAMVSILLTAGMLLSSFVPSIKIERHPTIDAFLNSQVLVIEGLYLLASFVFGIKYLLLPKTPEQERHAGVPAQAASAGPRSPVSQLAPAVSGEVCRVSAGAGKSGSDDSVGAQAGLRSPVHASGFAQIQTNGMSYVGGVVSGADSKSVPPQPVATDLENGSIRSARHITIATQ